MEETASIGSILLLGILAVLCMLIFLSDFRPQGIGEGLIGVLIMIFGAIYLFSTGLQEVSEDTIRRNEQIRQYPSKLIKFNQIKNSLYSEYRIVVFDVDDEQISVKVPAKILDIMTLKSDQTFILYYQMKEGKPCSVMVERDFAEKTILSKDEVCWESL